MSTTYSKAPRVRIPNDIQSGDILVLRDGQQKAFGGWDEDGDAWCGGAIPSTFRPDGRWVGGEDGDFSWHKWDVVAIERKIDRAVGVPKKLHTDKDAVHRQAPERRGGTMNEPSTPTDNPQPEIHTCHTCGYSWLHGRHGGHDCLGRLKDQLDSQAAEIERAKRTSALVSINQPVVTQAQIDHEEELARLAAGWDS